MDLEVLQSVLNLLKAPILHDSNMKEYAMRIWVIYLILVPFEGPKIEAKVYLCTTLQHSLRLVKYETCAYQWVPCKSSWRMEKSLSAVGFSFGLESQTARN